MIGLILLVLQLSAGACAGVPADHVATVEAQAERDLDAAIDAARDMRARAPDCATAHLAYAIAINRRLQEAKGLKALELSRDYRAALERTLELEPQDLRARMEYIEFFIYAPSIAGGSADRARREIVTLSRTHPLEAARLSVEVESRNGGEIAQLAALERWADLAPHDIEAVLRAVLRLAALERYQDAEQRLLVLAESSDPHAALASAYWRGRIRVLGRFDLDEAPRLIGAYIEGGGVDRFPQLLPSSARALYRLGEAYELNDRCEDAARYYAQATALDPTIGGLSEASERARACG